ncbi:hypothetical protein L6164_021506 [Bauhinia variegata]|uniref:Uncharacterized protein n=1 Tax=Bauhinia variegata TaxID=167791 RepID=A0ACB9MYP9_BAUVA|nr:hypothetical protein L6164_021506 [Bauhinia variegata]
MASIKFVICGFLIIFLAAIGSVGAERQFKVGDHLGWHEPAPNNTAFYNQWAAKNRFQIGDSLVFEYQNDSVLTVEKEDYYNCDSKDPIISFNNGRSIINLERAGPSYFISGTDNHCENGQRLIVEVMSQHPPHQISADAPSPSPLISAPPEAFSAEAPSPAHARVRAHSHSSGVSVSAIPASILMPLSATLAIVLLLAP